MSLWQEYRKTKVDEVLLDGVPNSMRPALYAWIQESADERFSDPYVIAVDIKNMFRIDASIPSRYPNSYVTPPPIYRYTKFMMNLAESDSYIFFTVLDYLIQTKFQSSRHAFNLGVILDQAGHKFAIHDIQGKRVLAERLPKEQQELMNNILESDKVYASEFQDAFNFLYSPKPDYTQAAGEAFQALESGLKYFIGGDSGNNLGAILNWLRKNPEKWRYSVSSDEQDDADEHFLSLINFVNKSYRKIKHGQADKKLTIEKMHAETILRAVAILIFELENVIVFET